MIVRMCLWRWKPFIELTHKRIWDFERRGVGFGVYEQLCLRIRWGYWLCLFPLWFWRSE